MSQKYSLMYSIGIFGVQETFERWSPGRGGPGKIDSLYRPMLVSPGRYGGPMKLSTRVIKDKDIVVIDVDGKVVLGDGDVEIKQAVDALLQQGKTKIILNLAKVPYLDSAGLGEIIRCFTALRRCGGSLKLLAPNPRIVDLLNITKLLNVFDSYDNEATAIKIFS